MGVYNYNHYIYGCNMFSVGDRVKFVKVDSDFPSEDVMLGWEGVVEATNDGWYCPILVNWGDNEPPELDHHYSEDQLEKVGKGVSKLSTTYRLYRLKPGKTKMDAHKSSSCQIYSSFQNLIDEGLSERDVVVGVGFAENGAYSGHYRIYRSMKAFGDDDHYSSCSGCLSLDHFNTFYEPIKEGEMTQLNKLTPQQESRMTAEDKALYQLGWISADLSLTDVGAQHLLRDYVFAQSYKGFAKDAQAEVDRIKAEESK